MKISNMNIPVKSGLTLAIPKSISFKTSEGIRCRDPFVLVYDGKYFLYSSASEKGIECIVSNNLENWSAPILVYEKPQNYHGIGDYFWAPECHYYKGHFYIFTSVRSKNTGHRNICVYRSESPLGPFEEISSGIVHAADWDTIDGTLYVDEEGQPWLVFVHEWTCMPQHNGAMAAVRLAEDFTYCIGEPIELFKARDAKWAVSGVTDGPYLYRGDSGKLMMIWSNFSEKGYAVGKAYSKNGKLDGVWEHEVGLLYEKGMRGKDAYDGGHAMLFVSLEDKLMLSYHSPNDAEAYGTYEHVTFDEVAEENGTLVLK